MANENRGPKKLFWLTVNFVPSPIGGIPGRPLSHRNIPTAGNHFDTAANIHGIALGFMHFDQHVFVIFVRNRPARLDADPIENVQVVEITLGGEEFALAERLFWGNVGPGNLPDEIMRW